MIDSTVEINCHNWPIIGHIRSLQAPLLRLSPATPSPLGFPVTFHNPLPPLSWSLVQATFFIVFNLPALYYSSRECHYDIIPSISQVNESWLVPASYPDVPLDVRAKEGGKETWSLAVITSHSRFALASVMRKTKRLRRRLWLVHLSPVWLSVFSLVPDLLFDCSRIL